jgi:hypothetical protein
MWKNQSPLAFSICCRQEKFLLFQGISFLCFRIYSQSTVVLSGRFVSFGAMYNRLLQAENF